MSNAPVCHISTDQGVTDQPGIVRLPTIPTPVDLASAIAAINALKLIVQMLAGQQAVAGPRGARGLSGSSATPSKIGRWNEVRARRVEKKVRVFNPKDKEQYVDVLRINQVVMKDSVTGEQWVWDR